MTKGGLIPAFQIIFKFYGKKLLTRPLGFDTTDIREGEMPSWNKRRFEMKAVLKQKSGKFYVKYIHEDRIEVNGKSFKASRDCFRRVSNDEGLYIKNYYKFSVVDAEQKNGAYFWNYEC